MLGKAKRNAKKPWIKQQTLLKVDEKRRYRQAKDISEEANSRYKQLKREVQQQIKKDKEDWFNEECATLEKLDATQCF